MALAGDEVAANIGAHTARWGLAAHRGVLFAPVVDGEVLPSTPWQGHLEVPLLVGHTRDEHRLFTGLEEATAEQAATAVQLFAPGPYPAAEPTRLHEWVHSDWLFRMPSLHLAERAISRTAVHVYELTFGGALGACRELDVPLVFSNPASGLPAAARRPGRRRGGVRADARRVDRVRHGDPGWPGFDSGLVRTFDIEPSVVPYPEAESRRIWRDHHFALLRLGPDRRAAVLVKTMPG